MNNEKRPTIGFTGTRNGMSFAQARTFKRIIEILQPAEFHHGDCVGSDAAAHDAVRAFVPDCLIHVRPGPPSMLSANRIGGIISPAKNYFARNRDIVDATGGLIACPPSEPLPTSGGTAYTVNYAKKRGKRYVIIWPSGEVFVGGPGLPHPAASSL